MNEWARMQTLTITIIQLFILNNTPKLKNEGLQKIQIKLKSSSVAPKWTFSSWHATAKGCIILNIQRIWLKQFSIHIMPLLGSLQTCDHTIICLECSYLEHILFKTHTKLDQDDLLNAIPCSYMYMYLIYNHN